MDKNSIIQRLNLKPHPEGGYYKRSYESLESVELQSGERLLGSAIYYLLDQNDYSGWHRIQQDELWHHYVGSPFKIHVLDPEKREIKHLIVGNPFETDGAEFQQLIRANQWFASELLDKSGFGLAGCTLSPAFHFDDFEMADNSLLDEYPELKNQIQPLLRV